MRAAVVRRVEWRVWRMGWDKYEGNGLGKDGRRGECAVSARRRDYLPVVKI